MGNNYSKISTSTHICTLIIYLYLLQAHLPTENVYWNECHIIAYLQEIYVFSYYITHVHNKALWCVYFLMDLFHRGFSDPTTPIPSSGLRKFLLTVPIQSLILKKNVLLFDGFLVRVLVEMSTD